jgi:site-specific DNA-cytosine methylase
MRYLRGRQSVNKCGACSKTRDMSRRIPTLDLFSGIGSNSLALRKVCDVVMYCDSDPFCRDILAARMRSGDIDAAEIHSDVRTLHGSQLSSRKSRSTTGRKSMRAPLFLTAGFPCQDASSANPGGMGVYGPRTGLFFEVVRILDETPSILIAFFENVPGLAFKGRGLDRIHRELKERGFDVASSIMGAWKELGAPAERERWYCMAVRGRDRPVQQHLLQRLAGIAPNPPAAWRRAGLGPKRLCHSADLKRSGKARHAALGNSSIPAQTRMAVSQLSSCLFGLCDRSRIVGVARLVGTKCLTPGCLRRWVVVIPSSDIPDLLPTVHRREEGCIAFQKTWVAVGGRDLNLSVHGVHLERWSVVTRKSQGIHTVPTARSAHMFCQQVLHEVRSGRLSEHSYTKVPWIIEHSKYSA